MKTNQKLTALFIITACTMTFSVNAKENTLEAIVGSLVTNVIENVSEELNQQIDLLKQDTKEWLSEAETPKDLDNEEIKSTEHLTVDKTNLLPTEMLSEELNQTEKAND